MQLAVNLPTETSAGPANHAAEAAGSAYDSQMVNDENHLAKNNYQFQQTYISPIQMLEQNFLSRKAFREINIRQKSRFQNRL